MVGFSQGLIPSFTTEDMPEEASILNLVCEVWNQAHFRRQNQLFKKIDTDFNISESLSWDEMKRRLEIENENKQKSSRFVSSSGRAAYQSVNSTILQVVCQDTLTEEETEKVKLQAKSENSNLNGQLEIVKGTILKLPLVLIESLQSKLKLMKYPSGFDQKSRTMIIESLTVFNLNDVHPAFFTLGHRLVQITKEIELERFLQQVKQERFDSLIQCLAHEEEVPNTGICPSTAEAFLSEEEKEVLREWKEDINQVHNPLTEFDLIEHEFMNQCGILEA